MTAYWLIITLCTAGSCADRLVDVPWPSIIQCRMAGSALVQSGIGYRAPFSCTRTKPPNMPLAPAPVPPGVWA